MVKRKIIDITEEKCNGCGVCIPNCPEGALQVIDGKVRLISDLFCDGLGACIKHCPQDAIKVVEREAAPYSEKKVMENIVKAGKNTIIAHLKHLKEHGEEGFLKEALQVLKEKKIKVDWEAETKSHGSCGCQGSKMMDFREEEKEDIAGEKKKGVSTLRQWPVQITLVPPHAPYFNAVNLLIAADCVPFAYPDFHQELLKGKTLLVGCPKLDDTEAYKEKLSEIFKSNDIKSITYAHMQVPCCSGMLPVIEEAIEASGRKIPFEDITISIKGERLD